MQISHTSSVKAVLVQEQNPLTIDDSRILSKIRDKKLLYIGSSYAALVAVLLLAWIQGWADSLNYDDEDAARFKIVAPFVILFFFITLTIFFLNYYLKAVHPFTKDIKKGVKELIYFEAESYKTPFFDTYYIKTPSRKNAMIRISKEMYASIKPGSKACLCLSPYARFVFSIDVEGKRLEFNEKNAIIYT